MPWRMPDILGSLAEAALDAKAAQGAEAAQDAEAAQAADAAQDAPEDAIIIIGRQ